MITRRTYLEQLEKWKNEKVIKVITGIRRCGKSTLLKQYMDKLREQGISDRQIIYLNMENLDFEDLLNYKELYKHIKEKLCEDNMTYVFIDEIQNVKDFQKAVDSLYIKENIDIYITGSNAYLLSGEIATFLSGRYIEINMLPFSFAEYCEIYSSNDKEKLLFEYMKNGSMPYITTLNGDEDKINTYLEGIYNTIIIKDIEERQKQRETDSSKRKVNDIVLLKNISRFLASSVGSPVSVKSISNYITSLGRNVSPNTVDDYVEALIEPYIFYPVLRFDITGKQLLKFNQKLYISDLGIRNYILPKKNFDIGYSLENTVYLELVRRGYTVNIGKVGSTEVDFVAKKDRHFEYFQVTASLTDESTFNREITPLKNISDNYPKTIITLDKFTSGDYEGIQVVNAIEWLTG